MSKSTLDADGQVRLQTALRYAGNDLKKVVEGVRRALHGVRDHARYNYLYYVLQKMVRADIKAKRKEEKKKTLQSSSRSLLDAYRHQKSLLSGIPAHDQ